MPALRRSLTGVINIAFAELRRVAKQEGPEGEYLLSVSDLTADYIKGHRAILLELSFLNKPVWRKEIPLSEASMLDMSDREFEEKITAAMRANLSLVAQMHHARLDQLFPKSIQDVRVEYDPLRHVKIVKVKFKNGHEAEATENESKTDLFTARCTMLYDLPPL